MKLRNAEYQHHSTESSQPVSSPATTIERPSTAKLSLGFVNYGVGAAVVAWVASKLGISLSITDGIEIVAVAGAAGAFLFHYGIKGAIQIIWHGVTGNP